MFSWINKYFFDHRIRAVFSLCLAGAIVISLLSYNSSDPSLNTSTSDEPSNLLGFYGSYTSDLLLQIFGLASALLPLGLLCWAFVLFFKGSVRWWPARVISLVVAMISLSSTFGGAESKALPAGLGGVLSSITISIFPQFDHIFIMLFASVAFLCFLLSTGFDPEDYSKIFANFTSTANDKTQLQAYDRKVAPRVVRQVLKAENNDNDNIEEESKYLASENYEAANNGEFTLPTIDLLGKYNNKTIIPETPEQLQQNAQDLMQVLNDFGVRGEVIDIAQGPVVTLYELEPSAGTKSSRVIGLSDDIARSLSAISTRIAVIPGRNVLGVELPNANREFFSLRDLIETKEYRDPNLSLPIILGKDLGGKPAVVDLAKMPHLLVAGTTGSGKSVAINAMIISLLYRHTPEQCKFIMIDPKMLELSVYDGIPHLLTPVVTEPGKAVVALKWAVKEMENRYRLMSNLGVRSVAGYNERIQDAIKSGKTLERTVQTGFDPETGKPIYESVPVPAENLPFIVVIVDEMADLMLVAGKDIESSVQRLAQMARAAGIHIIMATQRPSVDVITGVIKANFPSRVSFKVTSKIDSRTILGEQGAEQLLGMGDMLYMGSNSKIIRAHGPFVDDREVGNIAQFLKSQGTPNYITSVTQSDEEQEELNLGDGTDDDSLYRQAIQIVKRDRKVSTSYIQRCLRIGYNRAALIIERMESEGAVSAPNHSGKREILLPED